MGKKPSLTEALRTAGIDKEDFEGPKIDRRTAMKMFGAAGATGMASMLAGCSGDGDDNGTGTGTGSGEGDGDSTPPSDRQGGTMTVRVPIDEIWTLDPHYLDRTDDSQIAMNAINGMMRLNEDLELEGDIVSDWTIEGSNTIVFQLEEGMQFHNGDPLDAEAVKWSINRLRNLDDSGNSFKLANIDEISTNGDTEVTFHLERPDAALLVNMEVQMGRAGGIVHQLAEEYPDEFAQTHTADGEPISTGPFQITNREAGQSLTMERADTYWEEDEDGNQLPYLDEIVFDFIPEASTAWSALQSGDVDTVTNITYEFADQATQSNGLDAIAAKAGEWKSINQLAAFPHEHKDWCVIAGNPESESDVTEKWVGEDPLPTFDKRVRKAVSKAIDREEVVETGYFGFAQPAHGFFCPTLGRWYQPDPGEDVSGLYYNPEEAEQLLDEAGYTGDPRFSVEIVGREEDSRALTVIEQQLNDVGIDATVSVQSESAYWEDVYGYEAMMSAVGGAGELDPWTQWYRQFGTPDADTGRGTYQKNLWTNDDFDEAIENDWQTMDPDEREQYIEQGLEIWYDHHPYSMYAHPDKPKIKQPELKGMEWQNEYVDAHRAYFSE